MTTTTDYQALVTEEQMQHAVTELVELRGGRLFHVRNTAKSPELVDLPDWLIVAPWMHTVALLEAKSQKRAITVGQRRLLTMLEDCDRFTSGIVRPVPYPGELGYDAVLDWLGGNT